MSEKRLQVMSVIGSLNRKSVTKVAVCYVSEQLRAAGCAVDVVDFVSEPLALFDPDTSRSDPKYRLLQARVDAADVFVLGTPDYHGSMSGTLKSFLDHFWHEFAGKLFGTLIASHEKGLTVADQIRTVARQCYAWAMPYGVSFVENQDVSETGIVSELLRARLAMFARDVRVYGQLLAEQRALDLTGEDPSFMARFRKDALRSGV